MEWYRKTWVCIAFLIFIFPVGAFLLWQYHPDWKKTTKIILTVIMGAFFVSVIGSSMAKEYPSRLEILSDDIILDINEEKEVKLFIDPKDIKYDVIEFISDNEDIVSFESNKSNVNLKGNVVGLKEGTTTIYIQSKDVKSEKVTVTVEDSKRIAEEKANEVVEKIADIGQVTLDSENKIKTARNTYDSLDEESKKYVNNYDDLVQAEKEYEKLKEEKEQEEYSTEETASVTTDITENSDNQNEYNGSSDDNENSMTVYWTPDGKKYHVSKGCRTLKNSDTIYSGSVSEAQANGKSEECKVCG